MAQVLNLADRLRVDGVDADIDQYESSPPEGWPMWMDRQISEADFILVVCTETYKRRAEGKEEFGKGRGVIWECILTYQHLYNAAANNTKFLPIALVDSHLAFIPTPLQPASHYCLASEEGYEDLYRRLTNQPRAPKPPLGKIKVFDSRTVVLSKQPSLQRREHQKSIAKLWTLPSNRNPLFTGREEILAALRSDLQKFGRQTVCGFGGMGKSEIAVEYAYRHRDTYTAVLWVSADSMESIKTGFSKIARLLDLQESEDSRQDVVVMAVRNWLDRNPGWLFIFDSADTPSLLREFLPQQQSGHVLITSRAKDFKEFGIAGPIELFPFKSAEAAEFLLRRALKQDGQSSNGPELGIAETVAAELGYMPLALEQAGAFVAETQISLKDYVAKFEKQRLHL